MDNRNVDNLPTNRTTFLLSNMGCLSKIRTFQCLPTEIDYCYWYKHIGLLVFGKFGECHTNISVGMNTSLVSIPESFSTERISSGNYVSIVPAKQVGKATGLQLFITLFWCSTGSFGAIQARFPRRRNILISTRVHMKYFCWFSLTQCPVRTPEGSCKADHTIVAMFHYQAT